MDMDLLQGVRDAAEAANDAENPVNEESSPFGKMPSMNQILEMIETMNISDKEKEEIKKSIMSPNFEKLREFMPQHSNPAPFDPSRQYLYVLIGVAVLLLIFVFFGYKLYRSLTEKERKREEKRRQKQQKKKK